MKSSTCCEQVRPENSARSFKNPAPILLSERVQKILKSRNKGRILEIGAGCLRNSLYLLRMGFEVSVLEVKGMRERFPTEYSRFERAGGRLLNALPRQGSFDFGLGTFVIETICDPLVRREVVSGLRGLLRPGGCLILSVRGPSDLVTAWQKGKPCSDGYITPHFTFSRAYTRVQLQKFLKQCQFSKLVFLHKDTTKAPELIHVLAWRNGEQT